jgi:hypothetical protein
MDGAVLRSASVESMDIVPMRFPYKDHRPELTLLTKGGRGLGVFLEFSGQADRNLVYGGELRVKFDDQKPVMWRYSLPQGGSTGMVLLVDERDFVNRLMKAKVVMVDFVMYAQGLKVFSFDVSNLDLTKLGLKK